MNVHKVSYALPELSLGNADIRLKVKRRGGVLGTLLISRGAVVWRPKWQPGKGRGGRKLRWLKFDEVMRKHGQPEKRKKRKTRASKL